VSKQLETQPQWAVAPAGAGLREEKLTGDACAAPAPR
jgi:hypothetical protein